MKTSCRLIMAVFAGCLVAGITHAQVNEDTPGYFAFTQPVLDTAPSFTDLSFLNEKPAGAAGFIQVRDGHFVDGHGARIRFLGTNVTFGGALPDKQHAADLAGHLAKYGFNVIRFHHIDGRSAPNGLRVGNTPELDPAQLDKLDWFIYHLKQNGIYANLNLHVSWEYPGLPRDIPRTWRYGKGLDNF